MPETGVFELSDEDVENKSKKKRSGNNEAKDSKKVEKAKSKRKSSAGKGRDHRDLVPKPGEMRVSTCRKLLTA